MKIIIFNNSMDKNDCMELEEILLKRGLLSKESVLKNVIENKNIQQMGKILLAAAFIAGGVAIAITAPNLLIAMGKFKQKLSNDKKKSLTKAFYNLQDRQLVRRETRGGKIFFTITPKGRSAFFKEYIKKIKINKPKKWDRIWRVVIFDIPTEKNNERDILRDRLKYMGFFQFQKSAFITPFPCQMELEAVLEYYNLFKYVTYLEAEKISGEEKCRHYFNI